VNLQPAIIVDIDGTLAEKGERDPFDWDNVDNDTVHEVIVELVQLLHEDGYVIILVSGREEVCEEKTITWLEDNGIPYNCLFMRKAGDFRKDTVIKKEIYDTEIKGKYYVRFALDDRDQVVKMWRDEGLVCLQVAEGNF
jgi:trehalose-6-phosphatase